MSDRDLQLEVSSLDSGYVFVSGAWSIGEIRFDYGELGRYLSPDNYKTVGAIGDEGPCYSCRRDNEECGVYQYEIPLGTESTNKPMICGDCRDDLIEVLREFVEDNKCEVSLQNL